MAQEQPETRGPADPQAPESDYIEQIAALLAIGATVAATSSAIALLLLPLGVTAEAAALVLRFAVGPPGAPVGPFPGFTYRREGAASKAQFSAELRYRAAFILNSARRVSVELTSGGGVVPGAGGSSGSNGGGGGVVESARKALAKEREYWQRHRDAQDRRAEAARVVDENEKMFGSRLGWYARRDARTTAECLAAHGSNFEVGSRPDVGYPGQVHVFCRCRPGPPWPGGRTTNQATAFVYRRRRRVA